MRNYFIVAALLASTPAYSAIPKDQHWGWGYPTQPTQHHHHRHDASPAPDQVARLRADIVSLKRELVDIRLEVRSQVSSKDESRQAENSKKVRDYTPLFLASLQPTDILTNLPKGLKALKMATGEGFEVPLGDLPPEPGNAPLPIPSRPEGVADVKEARLYLAGTATPGYTMVRQGVSVSIGRLHPEFAIRLADAIKKARAAGLSHAGIFSAYRPPAFGVGGFSDKFNSLHSYGLAVDVVGIGCAGSKQAHQWKKIAEASGLYVPYGADNKAEFNHTQLVPLRVAPAQLRVTITASAPKDLERMWNASGVKSPELLPPVDYAKQ